MLAPIRPKVDYKTLFLSLKKHALGYFLTRSSTAIMNYKLVIFDFDGTLADSFPYFLKSVNVLADQYNFSRIAAETIDELRGMDARQLMQLAKLPAWKIPFIARSFIRLMAQDIDQINVFDGIPELLRQLSAHGVQQAIVSSNSKENVRRILGPDTASLIQHYECGTSLFGKQGKFKKVMAKSGVSPTDTISIGDEIRDGQAALAAGISFGGVSWGYARADALKLQPTTLLFKTVAEIASTVLGNHVHNT